MSSPCPPQLRKPIHCRLLRESLQLALIEKSPDLKNMSRKYAPARLARRPINDFQVFKGLFASEMAPFGAPVMVAHEALLMARDDQAKQAAGAAVIYAIYKRSENRIVRILEAPLTACLELAA